MAGIFLKDFKNIRGQLVYYFVVFAVLAAVSLVTRNIYFMGGVSFLGVSFPLSAFAADEKDRWTASRSRRALRARSSSPGGISSRGVRSGYCSPSPLRSLPRAVCSVMRRLRRSCLSEG